jgi:hypothetical protein
MPSKQTVKSFAALVADARKVERTGTDAAAERLLDAVQRASAEAGKRVFTETLQTLFIIGLAAVVKARAAGKVDDKGEVTFAAIADLLSLPQSDRSATWRGYKRSSVQNAHDAFRFVPMAEDGTPSLSDFLTACEQADSEYRSTVAVDAILFYRRADQARRDLEAGKSPRATPVRTPAPDVRSKSVKFTAKERDDALTALVAADAAARVVPSVDFTVGTLRLAATADLRSLLAAIEAELAYRETKGTATGSDAPDPLAMVSSLTADQRAAMLAALQPAS